MPTPTEPTPRPEGLNLERPGDVSHELQGQVKQVAEEAKRQGKEQLESYRQTAADELEKIAEGARAAASELEDQDEPALSNYVLNAAESMYELADKLRGKSIEDLIQQAGRLAHDNPTLFLAGSVALGFGLMRFARASSSRAAQPQGEQTGLGAGQQATTGGMAMGEIPTPVTATPDGSVTSAGRALGRGTHRLPPGELGHTGPGVSGSPLTGASSTPMTGTVTGAAASSNPAAGSPPSGGGAAGGPAGTSMPGTSTAGSPASGAPASGTPTSGTPDRMSHASTPKSDDQGPTGGMQ